MCFEEMNGVRKAGRHRSGAGRGRGWEGHQAFPFIISVTPSLCFSRRDHRRVHQGEWLWPGGGAAGPRRGAAAPGVSRGRLPEHRDPGPRGAPAPGHAAALGLHPGPDPAPGPGPRTAAAPGHHGAAQAARHALPLRVRGPLGRQHPRGEQHRGEQDAARHRGGARAGVSRRPAPGARGRVFRAYLMGVTVIAVAVVGADQSSTRPQIQKDVPRETSFLAAGSVDGNYHGRERRGHLRVHKGDRNDASGQVGMNSRSALY